MNMISKDFNNKIVFLNQIKDNENRFLVSI